jgi:hypothetical protein
MDLTPLEHGLIAVVCTGIGMVCGDIYAGAAFSIALFIGREHAQAEQRNIQSNYGNRRANAPWHVGCQTRAWDTGSVLDVVVPVAVAITFCLIWGEIYGRQ